MHNSEFIFGTFVRRLCGKSAGLNRLAGLIFSQHSGVWVVLLPNVLGSIRAVCTTGRIKKGMFMNTHPEIFMHTLEN